jgi:hypothetical protein
MSIGTGQRGPSSTFLKRDVTRSASSRSDVGTICQLEEGTSSTISVRGGDISFFYGMGGDLSEKARPRTLFKFLKKDDGWESSRRLRSSRFTSPRYRTPLVIWLFDGL